MKKLGKKKLVLLFFSAGVIAKQPVSYNGIRITRNGVTITPQSVYYGGYLQSVTVPQQAGYLDCSFNGGAQVVPHFGGTNNQYGTGCMLQPDGKLVVVGVARTDTTLFYAAVRCLSNGVLDTNFGGSGTGSVIIPTFGDANDDEARAGQLQADGKIVMAGLTYSGGGEFYSAVRLTQDGLPDTTFGTTGNGTVIINDFDKGSGRSEAHALQIQSDGKLVLAGYSDDAGNICFSVARLHEDGTPDSTFGPVGNGTYVLPYFGAMGANSVRGLQIQSDGKILLAGISSDDPDGPKFSRYLIARVTANGLLDTSFGTNGFVELPYFGGATNDQCNAIQLQPDGKILLCGFSDIGVPGPDPVTCFSIVRLLQNGVVDTTFANNGHLIIEPFAGGTSNRATCFCLQSDGKIVVGGYSNWVFHGETSCSLVRLLQDGSFDTTFGPLGDGRARLFTDVPNAYNQAVGVFLQPDQKFIMGGVGVLPDNTYCFFAARATNQFTLAEYQAEYPSQGGFY